MFCSFLILLAEQKQGMVQQNWKLRIQNNSNFHSGPLLSSSSPESAKWEKSKKLALFQIKMRQKKIANILLLKVDEIKIGKMTSWHGAQSQMNERTDEI